MTISERYSGVIGYFRDNVPIAVSELRFRNPFELLVATMLSAQCTDKRVNITTPALFEAYPDAAALAGSTYENIFSIIKSISYPSSKSKHLIATAQKLVSDFEGEVPKDIKQLMTLPGVGRKTANVVASIIWGEPVIAVDTHVFRVASRLGLSRGKTPIEVEKDLEKHITLSDRPIAHHWLLLHGRYVCTAKKPVCQECKLKTWCRYYQSTNRTKL